MKCAILQPHYLPWIGYFHLINCVDIFVFLDDVKFTHQSWQHRNKIIQKNKETLMLTVPVNFKENDIILDVNIDDKLPWRKKHISTIRNIDNVIDKIHINDTFIP